MSELNLIPQSDYIDACNAVREKDGSTGLILSGELGAKIREIPVGKPEQSKTVEITANGDYPVTPDVGKVLSEVIAKVNVPTGGGGLAIKYVTFTPANDEFEHQIISPFKDLIKIKIQMLMPNILADETEKYAPKNTAGVYIGRNIDATDNTQSYFPGTMAHASYTDTHSKFNISRPSYYNMWSSPFDFNFILGKNMNSSYFKFRAGIEYIWIGVGEE